MNYSKFLTDDYWPHRAILFGAVILILYFIWPPVQNIQRRLFKETFLLIFLPYLFLKLNGRSVGRPEINRQIIRNTLILLAILMPFYIIAGSVPQVRAYYPIWETGAGLIPFLELQGRQTVISIATETLYRGLLCVWISDIGRKSIFVSPIAYAAAHIGKPTVEVLGSAPADVIFGYFDYESNSIIPSILTHSLGMATVDFLCQRPPLFAELGEMIEILVAILV